MTADHAIDLAREALLTVLVVSSPILLAGLLVGLVMGLLQAITQVQEQTVAFVPKLLAMMVVLAAAMPWLVERIVEYMTRTLQNIPHVL